jgi:transposase
MAYCEKMRKKAVEYNDSNNRTFKDLKEAYGIYPSTYYEWKENYEDTGFYVRPKEGKVRRMGKVDPDKLREIVEAEPDLYLWEIADKFGVSAVDIHNRLKEMKITFKKRHSLTPKNPKRNGQSTWQN